ncbi:MAG: fucose isomerase, partial [Planctomycetota bacterium]
ERLGHTVVRAHEYDATKEHGFIDSQKRGLEVFREIDPKKPLIVCEAVWQYSQHLMPGLTTHQGPILTVANWSGQWPGLVGMLNLNGSLAKAGIAYSTLWSENFDDAYFLDKLGDWLETGKVKHSDRHVRNALDIPAPHKASLVASDVAASIAKDKAIMGVFDEGCMGMYNAMIPDELLAGTGVFKERLSQSALYAEMLATSDDEAQAVRTWLDEKGMQFDVGENEETDLTDA